MRSVPVLRSVLVGHSYPDDLVTAIRTLPISDRLRLVERVVRDAAADTRSSQAPTSLLGLMEDEPELVDQVCASALEARAKARLRRIDG